MIISMNNRISLLPNTANINQAGQLEIAGCDVVSLVEKFGTPSYLYDAATIKNHVARLQELLIKYYGDYFMIAYATKAYFSFAMAKKLAQLGIGEDIVSVGDIRTAQKAGLNPDGIHLHGNNKSAEEIEAAMDWGVQAIVVDSLDELEFLESLAEKKNKRTRIWLRITPDLTVNTHPHIQTSHSSSKFGVHTTDGQANLAIQKAVASPWLDLVGLHTHLGSQLRNPQVYVEAIEKMYALAEKEHFIPEEFSPGGGWGVRYTEEDPLDDPEKWIEAICKSVKRECNNRGWKYPRLVIEPGRYIVAQSGVALYTIGAQKETPEGEHIVAVDGGIADNPRVALYNATYTAIVANRPLAPNETQSKVVGKFCETGDVLINNVDLPKVKRGEILAIPVAGAYQLSMSSNYNFATRPTVLWVEDGKEEIMQRREHPEESAWWTLETDS